MDTKCKAQPNLDLKTSMNTDSRHGEPQLAPLYHITIVVFLQTEDMRQPSIEQVYRRHFPNRLRWWWHFLATDYSVVCAELL